MNFIYSLRYSSTARCMVAVSEITRKNTKKKIRTALLSSAMVFLLGTTSSLAGTVNNDISYQQFRDFAENKGLFQPGSINIPIFNKKGQPVGTLDKAPMPDFSSVDSGMGVGTLIDPQYIVSVAHNGGYQGVKFGDGENYYRIVDRNNAPGLDFHAPRLDKLVTEVKPTPVTAQGSVPGAYLDKNRYPVFYRLGSGTQYLKNSNNKLTYLSGAYTWLTGGTIGNPSSYQNGQMITNASGLVFDYKKNGTMPILGEAGDSGSPLFAWDTTLNKWVLVGVLTAGNGAGGRSNNWAVIPLNFVQKTITEDDGPFVIFDPSSKSPLTWSFDSSNGTGTLKQGTVTYNMHGKKGSDLNAGKNIHFSGKDGQVNLVNDVFQGAGYLRFLSNYTVSTASNNIWTGAGIIVDKLASVLWKLNGLAGDNLHKIGEGTLIVEGNGINDGGLKVGDGTVVLNQKPNEEGSSQAFSSVNIAGGTASVVLGNERQINPDNVSWGYRGGKLDLNGTDAIFHKLNAADHGAVLANDNNDKVSNVIINYQLNPHDIVAHIWNDSKRGTVGDLYEYNNPYSHTKDYFILKRDKYGYFPTSQNSDANWEYVGHELDAAQKLIAMRANDKGYIFHGRLEGNMNVDNRVSPEYKGPFVLDGSANMKGTFLQENGRLVLQGHPVIHAFNTQKIADILSAQGDESVRTQPTSVDQDDWEDRTFSFGKIVLKNADFKLGRNATLNTSIEADESLVTLGTNQAFIDKKDGSGKNFLLEEGISNPSKETDKSKFNGSVLLFSGSMLSVNNAIFEGRVEGDSGTWMHLGNNAVMNLTADSKVGNFISQSGKLSLVNDNWTPKKFMVDVMDASDMLISLGVNLAKGIGDQIEVVKKALGANNRLDISSMFDGEQKLKSDLTVASAPSGTARDYFSFASFSRGFSTFKPETQVVEKDGRVLWQLKHSEPEKVDIVPGTSVNESEDKDSGTTGGTSAPDDARPTTPGSTTETGTDNNGSQEKQDTSATDDKQPSFPDTGEMPTEDSKETGKDVVNENGISVNRKANSALLNKARDTFISHEYILSARADHWQQVADAPETDGGWAFTEQSYGKHGDFTLSQSGLNIGFKKSIDAGTWWSVSADLNRGQAQTHYYSNSYNMWGVNVYAGKQLSERWFVDGAAGFGQLNEDYKVNGELRDLSGDVRSSVFTGGLRTGYKFTFESADLSITPTVSLNGIKVSGSRLKGKGRTVELQGGDAIWLKTGIEAEKEMHNMKFKAGVWRSTNLSEMPGMTLSDKWSQHQYKSKNLERLTSSVGVEGEVRDDLHLKAGVNAKFDGYFKNNYEGVLGIRYEF
ncbi:autotransporter outer membrane beta-barrel domain-containing protein [Cronobacter sakazakii]|nr:autotransporter outer membrane beta-barrel domain-containing protein [Cronobacter sakazakii]